MTTIPDTQTRRVDQLRPGDVIHLDRDVNLPEELAEVRAVEPVTGSRSSIILLAGGKTISVGNGVVYERATAEAAQAWRAEQAELARRRSIVHALGLLGDLFSNEKTPLPDHTEPVWVSAQMPDHDAVRTVAGLLGVEATTTSSRTHAYLGGFGDAVAVDLWAVSDAD